MEFRMQRGLSRIIKATTSGSFLALPDPNLAKPFDLYIHERRGTTLGVVGQKLGPFTQVVLISLYLDQIAAGWPPCLQEVAATITPAKGS